MNLHDISKPSWEPERKPAEKPKRKKTGGRKRGSVNKKTLEKIRAAEAEIRNAAPSVTNPNPRTRLLAIEHMDEMIIYFRGLVAMMQPWNVDGTKREGRDEKLWLRVVEIFQGWLTMRAPYQSARLSAVAVMSEIPSQQTHRTTVNVTILNERGDRVYSDSDDADDAPSKIIEHRPSKEEEAA